MDKEEIRKEAKEILDNFSKSLNKVKFKEKKGKSDGNSGMREEKEGMKGSEDFRMRMFDNSPEKEGDYIIAEKKNWQ